MRLSSEDNCLLLPIVEFEKRGSAVVKGKGCRVNR